MKCVLFASLRQVVSIINNVLLMYDQLISVAATLGTLNKRKNENYS